MIYAGQTSLIPVSIALARFLENGGNILVNYPYWYLGTTPFRFLTGPILPFLLLGVHKVFPGFSLFSIFYFLFSIFWLTGVTGIYWLVRGLGGERKTAILAAFFYFFGPIVPFLFRFSDGLYLITFSLLPFTLAIYLKLLKDWSRREAAVLVLATTFLFLLDSLIIPTLFLGMAAILLATTGWGKLEQKIRQTLFIFLFSFLISTLWYTPSYWLTLLAGPSWAGKGLILVIEQLMKLLPTALALVMAVVIVRFFKKRNILRDFCFYWVVIFGFLTLIRFLSDPDFWLDWIAYGTELQLGMAMVLSLMISKIYKPRISPRLERGACGLVAGRSPAFNLKFKILLFTSYILLFTFLVNKYVLGTIQRDITKTVEYRIGKKLSEIVKPGQRVFLSGTTGFWLNALFDIPQVRGGVDQVAVDSSWRKAVWEVREGKNLPGVLESLRKGGVVYLVVHTEDSEEFYHDFSFPEEFEGMSGLKKIYEERGNRIYQILE